MPVEPVVCILCAWGACRRKEEPRHTTCLAGIMEQYGTCAHSKLAEKLHLYYEAYIYKPDTGMAMLTRDDALVHLEQHVLSSSSSKLVAKDCFLCAWESGFCNNLEVEHANGLRGILAAYGTCDSSWLSEQLHLYHEQYIHKQGAATPLLTRHVALDHLQGRHSPVRAGFRCASRRKCQAEGVKCGDCGALGCPEHFFRRVWRREMCHRCILTQSRSGNLIVGKYLTVQEQVDVLISF